MTGRRNQIFAFMLFKFAIIVINIGMTAHLPVGARRIVPFSGLLLSLLFCLSFSYHASAADLVTANGRRFHNCEVLKADTLGLYLRHDHGIARLLYEDLSDGNLAQLEPLPEIETISGAKAQPADVPAATDGEQENQGNFSFVFQQRVTLRMPQPIYQPAFAYGTGCGLGAGPMRIARYPCRRMAERDFLITSGILPRPYGVVTRYLPRGWRSYPRHWRRYY